MDCALLLFFNFKLKLMGTRLEVIDGSLHLLENDEIIHEFERGPLLRAAYKHMCAWMLTNFDPKLNIHEQWTHAQIAWESLSLSNQTAIWSIVNYETQSAKDISQGLLATLNGYQGSANVKEEFKKAIQSVRYIFE